MKNAKRKRLRPKCRPGAELIIKSNCEWSSWYPGGLASGVFVLGNKQGLRWLSDYLVWIAKGVSEESSFDANAPDDHQHVEDAPAVNQQLSDAFGIMIGSFNMRHRRRIFKFCGVSKAKRVTGSPIRHLLHHLSLIESACQFDRELSSSVVQELVLLNESTKSLLIRLKAAGASKSEGRTHLKRKGPFSATVDF